MAIVFRTAKELKDHLPRVLRTAQKADVIITMRGKPLAILRRYTLEELEGAILMQSRTVRRRMKQALADARAGKTIPLDTLVEQVAAAPR
jgi:hypothetical protein